MAMITRVLVANRGEIARRVFRTCRALGVDTVAVFSEPDAHADFVADADHAVALGGDTPASSYLRGDAIVEAAVRAGADAVHPGYGFLAENAAFARAVTDAGLTWVGPSPEAIEVMGSKLGAKALMEQAGVPLLPSADLSGADAAAVAEAGDAIGFPVLIKASAGGGGRGMRIVADPAELAEAVTSARREAGSAFGDDTVYAERYVAPSRHVEVQIFGDASGRVIHFGERECSIQRRHQKIVEEAPSPSLDADTRAALHAAAVRAGEAIGYTNAGTVEFLLAPTGEFFFLEVNTRLQVEHPVTEAVHGVDLVALQLAVASGGAVPDQADVGAPAGHAIEARLYAEDPTADYLPSTGPVHRFAVPGDVRVDTSIDRAGAVSQFYDPMIAKVVAHGPTRTAAARRLASALAGATVDGIATNRALLVRTLRHPEFVGSGDDGADNRGDSDFLARHDAAALGRPLVEGADLRRAAACAALALQAARRVGVDLVPGVASGFRNVPTQGQSVELTIAGAEPVAVSYRFERGRLAELAVDGEPFDDTLLWSASPDVVDLTVDGIRQRAEVTIDGGSLAEEEDCGRRGAWDGERVTVVGPAGSVTFAVAPRFTEPGTEVAAGSLLAAMPGTIVAVHAAEGDEIEPGATLVVMEAMKMELAVTTPTGGTVTSLPVTEGQTVEAGDTLAIVTAPD